jgi:PAS domain S-box-containing protein
MAMPAPIPAAEERRLAALHEYDLLDTPSEPLFDAFTRLASALCAAPMSLITLIDTDRQWFKSAVGIELRETPREIAFCAHTILGEGIFEVGDASADPRFADNPLVTGEPHIRFYAGVPLRSREGDAIGTICVLDRHARALTPEQRTSLDAIGDAVMEQLEARRALLNLVSESERAQRRLDLYSAAIEAAHDPISILQPGEAPEGGATVVYANEAFLRMKGATRRDQVVGHNVNEFYGPKTERATMTAMRAQLMAGRAAQVEYISYRLDGSAYHTEASARPLFGEGGKTTHYVMVQRDVTEQVLRGAQLTMQNERLTAITSIARTLFASLEPSVLVEALLFGVHELLEGQATLYAPRPRGGFGATTDLSLHDDAPSGDAFVGLASRSDVCVLDEAERRAAVRVPGSGGGTAYVLDVQRAAPFGTADVFALGLLGQYFAVAARNVELYLELASRRDAVVELNQVKNDLIAMLAHDFKGPLTTIVGFADVLSEDDRFDQEARQYLGMISSSAMRLASLATDTLALSRLEHNELAVTLADVDLAGLVRDVVRVFSVTRPIDLRVMGGNLVVSGDAARLRQVVENLIGNAIKYSPGGEAVEVALRARQAGVEIAVRDRGIGIPEGERGKLFGRFARASNARALGIGGTGFGLYLTKTIVDLHGGSIDVESVEGQGSTFRVLVPTRAAQRSVAPIRIALLDADGDARSYVAQALRDDGFAVSVATSGEELLHLLGETHFDVALVDADRLGMPSEHFVTRANGTPMVRIALRMPASHDGWNSLLTKPFLMKDLYGAVDAALNANGGRSSAPTASPGSA